MMQRSSTKMPTTTRRKPWLQRPVQRTMRTAEMSPVAEAVWATLGVQARKQQRQPQQ